MAAPAWRSEVLALPQRHRLRGQRLFDALYRKGRAVHGAAMVLRWLPAHPKLVPPEPNPEQPSPWRCGVVISTKVHKRAVQRNRLRRQLHQGVLQQLRCSSGPPVLLLISLKPGSATWESHRLLGECQGLLEKAGLTP